MARLIAVTGKGGVGKTVMTALVLRQLRQGDEGPILALDADPDSNLGTVLGIPVQTSLGHLREEVLRKIKDLPAGMSKQDYIEAGFHQLIVETPKIDLITMGHGEGPGCYCFINHLIRKFAEDLMPCYQWVVMDNEAGLEHLNRRTASRIDFLIVVVNDNPLSTDCARRIDALLDDLGRQVPNRYFLVNATRPDRVEAVRNRLAGGSLQYLGCIPRDDAVEERVFRGESLLDLPEGPAVSAMREVMQRIGAC